MQIPNARHAEIDRRKVIGYLLSPDHPTGRDKARFFASVGYTLLNADRLEVAIRRIAEQEPVIRTVETAFGITYVVDGPILAASGPLVALRTVWFLDRGAERPRFITAYPARQDQV